MEQHMTYTNGANKEKDSKAIIKTAFAIYTKLLQEGMVSKTDNPSIFIDYQQEEVRDFLHTFTNESDTIIIEIQGERLYLVRNLSNPFMAYSAKELRNKMKFSESDGNKAVHLIYLIILHIIAEFYDTNDVSYIPMTQFVSPFEIAKRVQETMDMVRKESSEWLENTSRSYELNLLGAARLLEEYDLGRPDPKDLSRTKTISGLVLRTIDFLIEEGLVTYFDGINVRITEKMQDLIENYYFDRKRKELIMSLFHETLLPKGRENIQEENQELKGE